MPLRIHIAPNRATIINDWSTEATLPELADLRVTETIGNIGFEEGILTRDADRVKEHTGTEPEELAIEELAQAMDQLGNDKQQVTAAVQEIEAPGGATTPAGATGDSGYMDEPQQVADLNKAGILTDEEFAAKKAQILGL